MKINSFKNNTKGFTLVELLIYVAGLLAIGSVITMLIVQFYSMYKEIVSIPRADRTGLLVVDRIIKEIRSSDQVDLLESQFNTTNGVLDLDYVVGQNTTEKKFYVENGIVKYQEDSGEAINLSSKDFVVSNFYFTLVPTPVSEAVRFDMELQFQTKNATETKSYTGFAIIRESYE